MPEEFVEYVRGRAPRLRQRAYLMCRDRAFAHDLTQDTLAKLYVSWERAREADNLDAYVSRIMLRTFLDHKRSRAAREVAVAEIFPHGEHRDASPETRLALMAALRRLPARDRAIVVLRYWEDHSVESVAAMLNVSTSMVKTRSMRALARLRQMLATEATALAA
jgi:RNA polymerase sigma-70 factor (sigma-E family)